MMIEINISNVIVSPELNAAQITITPVFSSGQITPEERAKLAGIEENANDYTHPDTHPASILDVVDVVNGAANKFLNERGEMVAVAHEALTDKNSEAAFQHVDTTVTKPNLDEADMVAVKDSVTGKMVLTPKTELAGSTNLLYEYVHSGNKEVYISSIDYATNTFTSVNHGLVNGDRLGLKIISDGIIENVIPFTDAIPQTASTTGYYVINSAGDTFQISAASGGTAITTINKATQDFSKWRFEVLIAQTILLPNIPSIGCEIEVIGDIMQLNRYVYENSYPALSSGYNQPAVNSTTLIHANTYLLKGWYRISIRKTGTSMFVTRKYVGIQLDTTNSARIKWVTAEIIMLTNGDVSLIDNILLSTAIFTNGTIINVYKI